MVVQSILLYMWNRRKFKMKKIFLSLMLVLTLLFFPMQTFAMDSQNASVEFEYELEGSYQFIIPANVVVGNEFQLSVTDYNIASDKHLEVVADGLYSDNTIHLFNAEDADLYVGVGLYANGERITMNNRVVGILYGNDSISFTTSYETSNTDKAGRYTGIMNFVINCQQN